MAGIGDLMFINFEEKYIHEIIDLWNRQAVNIGYKEFNIESFEKIVLLHVEKEHFILQMDKSEKLLGFAFGVRGKENAYITSIILEETLDEKEYFINLLEQLERTFLEKNICQFDFLFFNPITLPWYIKGTNKHEHNNAPGVFINSKMYKYLCDYGYETRTIETAYYLNLKDFIFPDLIKDLEEEIEYNIGLYNGENNLEEMLESFNNPLWEKEILECKEKNTPFVIASLSNNSVGFAGPIIKEKSGRGYFSGIGVMKEHEGNGLGKILFYHLCKEMKNSGVEYMSLFTGRENKAKNIYLKAGFKQVEEFAVMRKIIN